MALTPSPWEVKGRRSIADGACDLDVLTFSRLLGDYAGTGRQTSEGRTNEVVVYPVQSCSLLVVSRPVSKPSCVQRATAYKDPPPGSSLLATQTAQQEHMEPCVLSSEGLSQVFTVAFFPRALCACPVPSVHVCRNNYLGVGGHTKQLPGRYIGGRRSRKYKLLRKKAIWRHMFQYTSNSQEIRG